jgi:squalene cyclase
LPSWLPEEYAFLKKNLKQAIVMEDPETMGEFLDTLKSFGLPDDHSLIRKGVNYLLSQQNPDGSWGDIEAEDIYRRYHPTWTAVDGLRDYAWHGKRLSFPRLKPLLKID